ISSSVRRYDHLGPANARQRDDVPDDLESAIGEADESRETRSGCASHLRSPQSHLPFMATRVGRPLEGSTLAPQGRASDSPWPRRDGIAWCPRVAPSCWRCRELPPSWQQQLVCFIALRVTPT